MRHMPPSACTTFEYPKVHILNSAEAKLYQLRKWYGEHRTRRTFYAALVYNYLLRGEPHSWRIRPRVNIVFWLHVVCTIVGTVLALLIRGSESLSKPRIIKIRALRIWIPWIIRGANYPCHHIRAKNIFLIDRELLKLQWQKMWFRELIEPQIEKSITVCCFITVTYIPRAGASGRASRALALPLFGWSH